LQYILSVDELKHPSNQFGQGLGLAADREDEIFRQPNA
jgi:hypothetical protein